jgi:Rad3-related DNA helicase
LIFHSVVNSTYIICGIDLHAKTKDIAIQGKNRTSGALKQNPFIFYHVSPAIILLRQGFGCLIRSTTDTGVVAILDPRIKSKFYGKYFLNSLPYCKKVSDIEDIENFLNPAHNHVD